MGSATSGVPDRRTPLGSPRSEASATLAARAAALDAADPLRGARDAFVFADRETIYLDGNSLGRLPVAARDALRDMTEEWSERLVGGWHDWIDWPARVGDRLGEVALGAAAGQVLVCDSVTVNLFKLAGAALAQRPGAVVVARDEFPTDRYVLGGLAGEVRWLDEVSVEAVREACADGGCSLVVLSHVHYRSGALADLPAITATAHGLGARVLWDLSHSAGVVPAELDASGVDLAVGCTYKYLCAGPGAPAFLYVRRECQDELVSPIRGWFGQADQFAMERPYEPAPGVGRFLAGTPSILGLAAVDAALGPLAEAGLRAVRAKAMALTDFAVACAEAELAPLGFSLGSPRDAARRGAHVSVRHPDAWRICRAMIETARVVPDFRGPDSVRLGLPPLYTSFADVAEGIGRVRALVERGDHERVDATRLRVT